MTDGAKHTLPNSVGRWLTRWLLVGAAVLGVVIAAVLGLLERSHESPGLPALPTRADTAQLMPGVAPEQTQAAFGFAFLDQPRTLPDLGFFDDAGRPRSLAEFRGRAIVLNIWATWCIPCRKEMPTLDHLEAMLGGSDILVLPLSIDRQGPSVVQDFYKEIGVKSLGVYVDPSGDPSNTLGLMGIPTTLLVDRQGREIGRKIGPLEWDAPQIVALIRTHLGPAPANLEKRASP